MAFAYSDTLVADVLAPIIADFPAGSVIEFFSGAPPAITAAPTGSPLGNLVLPATPLVAGVRSVVKNGVWQFNAGATGILGWWRLKDAVGTDADAADNTHRRVQGSVTATGGGGDMTVDNTNVTNGQLVTITGFSISVP